ncbi:hypothetical protein DL767_004388 [Monosporascus sp. MG133]|nr:hypothetical protein DL767_004388 [Monosporascus sp. MG133]
MVRILAPAVFFLVAATPAGVLPPLGPQSPQKTVAVWNLLRELEFGLNLTHPDKAGIYDNYVFYIDTVQMNKTDVIPYMDGSGPKPESYA